MAANDDAKELKSIVDALTSKVKDLNDSLKSTSSLVGESINPFKEILTISEQLNDHRSKEKQLTSDQIKNLSEKVKKERENLFANDKALDARYLHLINEKKKFEDAWKKLQKGKIIKDANLFTPPLDNDKAKIQLYKFVEMKYTISEYVWNILTGFLVTSISYNYIINAGCAKSPKEMQKRHAAYEAEQEEESKKEKERKDNEPIYQITP